MPVKTLKTYLVASAPHVFFLVVAAAMILLQQAGATTSWTYPCLAEDQACTDDEKCNECETTGDAEAFLECTSNYERDTSGACTAHEATPCCIDFVHPNDCARNSAFVAFWLCFFNDLGQTGSDPCTTLTWSGLSGGEPQSDDDVDIVGDDDTGVADDDGTGVANDDVTGVADDDVLDSDAEIADDETGVADDDITGGADDEAGVADDDAGTASDTGGASRVGSSSTNIALTAARGLALYAAVAPFLAACP